MSGILHKAKDKLSGHGDLTSGGHEQSSTQSSMGKGFNTVDDVSDHSGDVSKDEQIAALAEAVKANGSSGGSDGVVTGRGEMANGVQNANTGDSGGRSGGI